MWIPRSEDTCGAVRCAGGLSSDRRWVGIHSGPFFGIMSSEKLVSCAESLPFVRRTGVPGVGVGVGGCREASLGSRARALEQKSLSVGRPGRRSSTGNKCRGIQ